MLRHALLYDRDCGFCRWALGWVLRWDRRGALRPVALQDTEADELLAGMPAEQRMASWHLVAPTGELRSAGPAAAPLLRLLPGGGPVAALVGRFPGGTERAYRWVVDHRSVLGRAVTSAARRRADAMIERRR